MNMKSSSPLYAFFLLCALHAFPVQAGRIELTGFVPPGIDAAFVNYEYRRLWKAIVPFRHPDTSGINILFFNTHGTVAEEGLLPEWGGGGAIGRDRIVVPIDRPEFLEMDLGRTLVHELAHIVLNRAAPDRVYFPRWFHEGVAMALSGDLSEREKFALSKAMFSGSLMPLASVDSVNLFPQFRAELAYAQSRLAVEWLVSTYGVEVIGEIVEGSVKRGSFSGGLDETLKIGPREFESSARNYLLQTQGRFWWILDEYLVWALISLFALFSFVTVYILNRIKMNAMDAPAEGAAPAPGPGNSPQYENGSYEYAAEHAEDAEFDDYADQIGLVDDDAAEDAELSRPFDDDDGGEECVDEVDDWDDEGQDGLSWWEEEGYGSEAEAMK